LDTGKRQFRLEQFAFCTERLQALGLEQGKPLHIGQGDGFPARSWQFRRTELRRYRNRRPLVIRP